MSSLRHRLESRRISGVQSILMLVRLWQARSRARRQLAALSDRELQDIGICWSEVAFEASKPFWRK